MIIRALVRLWRWLTLPPRESMSDDWIAHQNGREYDDNPKAKSRKDE